MLIKVVPVKAALIKIGLLFFFLGVIPVSAADLKVAVSANFKPLLEILAKDFEVESGHRLLISSASTGVLYNQIVNGAPFDVFLSADALRPKMLEDKGLTVADTRQPYALGQLVLWEVTDKKTGKTMTLNDLSSYQGRLAIANPATAPYGLAAQQVLEQKGLWSSFKSRLVQGASIQQAWQFVASGNIPMGMVAKSQLPGSADYKGQEGYQGHVTAIPEELYDPIQQDLVILKRTRQPEISTQFVTYLLSEPVQKRIASNGYSPVNPNTVALEKKEDKRDSLNHQATHQKNREAH